MRASDVRQLAAGVTFVHTPFSPRPHQPFLVERTWVNEAGTIARIQLPQLGRQTKSPGGWYPPDAFEVCDEAHLAAFHVRPKQPPKAKGAA